MKAVYQKRYGSPDDLLVREVDKPVPGDNEVVVRVRAASLHPDVWHAVTGRPYVLRLMGAGLLRPKNPIPGTDMAGVVEAVGKNAQRFRPADEVFGETLATMGWVNGGAFAEYVAVAEDNLELKPGNVSFEQAACVPTSGYILMLNLGGPNPVRPGQKVLVNGAGGGVGSLALQLMKASGVHVTAVDTSKKLDMLRDLGADEVIDFTKEDFTERGERYDLVFDVPGNRPFSVFRRVLEPHGRYVPIGHEHFGAVGKHVFGLMPHFFKLMFLARFTKQLGNPGASRPSKRETMVILRDLLEVGTILPVIDRTFPLGEIVPAVRHMIGGEPNGRVVLIC